MERLSVSQRERERKRERESESWPRKNISKKVSFLVMVSVICN